MPWLRTGSFSTAVSTGVFSLKRFSKSVTKEERTPPYEGRVSGIEMMNEEIVSSHLVLASLPDCVCNDVFA